MFKANGRKWLTRLSAFTLAATVALTSINLAPTLTVHATENHGGQDSGGNTGGGNNTVDNFADLNFTGSPAWNINYQGYRFYVIDQKLERISDIYDYRYVEPTGIGEALFNTRFDGAKSPSVNITDGHVHMTSISDLISQCQQTMPDKKTIPYPIIKEGSWKGNGHNFKLWFMGEGDPMEAPTMGRVTGSSSGGSGTNKGGSGGRPDDTLVDIETGEIKDEQTEPKRDEELISKGKSYYKLGVSDTYKTIAFEPYLDEAIAKYKDSNSNNYRDELDIINEAENNFEYAINKKASQYESTYSNYVRAYWKTYPDMTLAECKYAAIATVCKKTEGVASDYLAMSKLFNECEFSASYLGKRNANIITLQDNLLTQSIPLTGDGAATIYPITYYGELKNEPNGFYMPNHVDKYPDLGTALDNGCALVVEPLTWINVRTNARNSTNRDWGAASSYKSTKTYGSYYNIVQEWKSTGGTYSSIIDYTLPNCMATSKDFITDTGYKVIAPDDYTSKKIPSVGKDLVNRGVGGGNERYGLSMHIYSNFGGSSSSTSTYDDPHGTTIAPAPDPSSLPPETSDYPTTSKQVTIIKNYVTREESIGTEVVDGNFIRQQNPHIIDIEDEPEYTVVQWETSTHLPPIQHKSIL